MQQLGEYILARGLTFNIDINGGRSWIFSVMFSPTIMLLIGGFTIAAAVSKTNIDRVLITRVLSLAGTRPNVVLLAVMGVACFASMWIRCGDSQALPFPYLVSSPCLSLLVMLPRQRFALRSCECVGPFLYFTSLSHAHLAYRSQSCGLFHRRHLLGPALS
jgi:hypothetical protein